MGLFKKVWILLKLCRKARNRKVNLPVSQAVEKGIAARWL